MDPLAAYRKKVLVVGIAGASGSGKTTLVKWLQQHWQGGNLSDIVHGDSHFQTRNSPYIDRELVHYPQGKERRNMETPEGVNFPAIIGRVNLQKERLQNTGGFIFVEGFLLFSNEDLMSHLDIKIFIDVDKDTSYTRRLNRKKRSNVQEFTEYYDHYVWPCYLEYNAHVKHIPDVLIVDGRKPAEEVRQEVIQHILKRQKELLEQQQQQQYPDTAPLTRDETQT